MKTDIYRMSNGHLTRGARGRGEKTWINFLQTGRMWIAYQERRISCCCCFSTSSSSSSSSPCLPFPPTSSLSVPEMPLFFWMSEVCCCYSMCLLPPLPSFLSSILLIFSLFFTLSRCFCLSSFNFAAQCWKTTTKVAYYGAQIIDFFSNFLLKFGEEVIKDKRMFYGLAGHWKNRSRIATRQIRKKANWFDQSVHKKWMHYH